MTDPGFEFGPGKFSINYGGRKVAGFDRRHVTMLTSDNDLSISTTMSFPDVQKSWAYNWQWVVQGAGFPNPQYDLGNSGDGYITAIADEWSQDTVLGTVPGGCNLAAMLVTLAQTTAPATTWNGTAVATVAPLGEAIAFTGSLLLEVALGMTRAMSVIIEDGNLILRQQQSVGPPPGGFGAYGSFGSTVLPAHYNASGGSAWLGGGEWVYGPNGPGIPIYHDGTMHAATTSSFAASSSSTPVPILEGRRYNPGVWEGAGAVPVTAATDYSSAFSLEITAKLGLAS
jgi:hypothetical protein